MGEFLGWTAYAPKGNYLSLSPQKRLPEFTTGCILVSLSLRGMSWAPAEAASVFSWNHCSSAPHVEKRNVMQK